MDPRVEEHARIICDHSVGLEEDDTVVIWAPPAAGDLVIALMERIGNRGAYPINMSYNGPAQRAFLRAVDPEEYEVTPDALLGLMERVDVVVQVKADENLHETGDVPPENRRILQRSMKPVGDEMQKKRSVLTQHPAPGNAQAAEMSTAAYAAFVYDAVNKDWAAQRAFQSTLVDRLDGASEVTITSGETTHLTLSVDGMIPKNDFGELNLPGGEVFIAPNPSSVDGEVLFDMPLLAQGREVEDVYLRFEDGEVVEASASKNEAVLRAVLETDEGAKRIGELGIGMNRDIDRFTYNMLFDEKMGDTVHLALGRSIDETVGPDREGNDSAIHMDMLVDMAEDSTIVVDGDVVQRDGTFVFEDGFDR